MKSIPLSSFERDDQNVWTYNKNGQFIVQGAYHLHKAILASCGSGSSQAHGKQIAWKSI